MFAVQIHRQLSILTASMKLRETKQRNISWALALSASQGTDPHIELSKRGIKLPLSRLRQSKSAY